VSGDAFALFLGTVLAVGALAYVLYPLFFMSDAQRDVASRERQAGDSAVATLKEIEFDRATGKLSDADYAELRRAYSEQAIRELRAADLATVGPSTDSIEERIHAYRRSHRECPDCGLRPETDAVYCSTCGAFLDRRCRDCGNVITESSATFCSACGGRLVRGARATGA